MWEYPLGRGIYTHISRVVPLTAGGRYPALSLPLVCASWMHVLIGRGLPWIARRTPLSAWPQNPYQTALVSVRSQGDSQEPCQSWVLASCDLAKASASLPPMSPEMVAVSSDLIA